jgi:hypothetical protein
MDLRRHKKKETDDKIILDKEKIFKIISTTAKYETSGIQISKWIIDKDYYIVNINKNNIKFQGIFNENFERNGYAISSYSNNENYFGYYKNDIRNKEGIYTWPIEIENQRRKTEFYWGIWRDNIKEDHGIYLWLDEDNKKKPFEKFDDCIFDVYLGEIDNDSFTKGVYLSKTKDNYYIYYGGYDIFGKRDGANCYYYNSNEDKVFYGSMKKGLFENGFMGVFDNEGKIYDLFRVEFDSKQKIRRYLQRDDIDTSVRERVEWRILVFRSLILEDDYFNIIFKAFKNIVEFKDKKFSLKVLNSDEGYNKIKDVCFGYNNIDLFRKLEKNLRK